LADEVTRLTVAAIAGQGGGDIHTARSGKLLIVELWSMIGGAIPIFGTKKDL
jgi:hypothetical protein